MAYVRYEGASTEYQGESFTRTLTKKDGSIWTATEVARFALLNIETGSEITSDSLTKSGDNLGLIFEVSKNTTASLEGFFKLVVYLEDTVNLDFSDVIAEYILNYETIT